MYTTSDNSFIRHLRNFVIISFLILLVFAGCFYITGTLVIFTVTGKWDIIKNYLNLPLLKQFIYIYDTLFAYWKFYFNNASKITPTSYNGFVWKLWVTTILPYFILLVLGWTFRAPIIDWRPFKAVELIHGNAHWATKNEIKKEQQTEEIEEARILNQSLNKLGNVIVCKMKMMKSPDYNKGYLNVFPNFKHQFRTDGFGCSSLSPMSLGPSLRIN